LAFVEVIDQTTIAFPVIINQRHATLVYCSPWLVVGGGANTFVVHRKGEFEGERLKRVFASFAMATKEGLPRQGQEGTEIREWNWRE